MMNRENSIGRSLIEMLGVIALISLITVGGMQGFKAAMNIFHPVSTQQEIEELAQGVVEIYSWKPNFAGVGSNSFLCDNKVLRPCNSGFGWKNVWGGTMLVSANGSDSFKITLTNVPKTACSSLIGMRWINVIPPKECKSGKQDMVFVWNAEYAPPCEGDGCGSGGGTGGDGDPDLCARKTCNSPHGMCDPATGICVCTAGYTGSNCEQKDVCSSGSGYVKPSCPVNTSNACYSLTGPKDSCGNSTCRAGIFSDVTHQDLNGEGCCVSKVEKFCSLSPISPRTCTKTCEGECEGDGECNLDKCRGHTPIEAANGSCYDCNYSNGIWMWSAELAKTKCVDKCASSPFPRLERGGSCYHGNQCVGGANYGTPILDSEGSCYACDYSANIDMGSESAVQECVSACAGGSNPRMAIGLSCYLANCKGSATSGSPIRAADGSCYACNYEYDIYMSDEGAASECVSACAGGPNPRKAFGPKCIPANKCQENTPIMDNSFQCYACNYNSYITYSRGDPLAKTNCVDKCSSTPNPRIVIGSRCVPDTKCTGSPITGTPIIGWNGMCYACDSTSSIDMDVAADAKTYCVDRCEGQRHYNNSYNCDKCATGTYNPTGTTSCTTCPTNFATLTKAGYCKACGGTWNGSSCSGCPSGQTPYCGYYSSDGVCIDWKCQAGACTQQPFPVYVGPGKCCTSSQTAYCSDYYGPGRKCSGAECLAGKCVPYCAIRSNNACQIGDCCPAGKTVTVKSGNSPDTCT